MHWRRPRERASNATLWVILLVIVIMIVIRR